jgi:hypothetical protein
MPAHGLKVAQWLLIGFFILLAAVLAREVIQDFKLDQRLRRGS